MRKSISKVASWDEKINKVITEGWCKRVEDGKNTKFWQETWIRTMSLKLRFLRLYSVSLQKEKYVANMGFQDGLQWHWNLVWRRSLF